MRLLLLLSGNILVLFLGVLLGAKLEKKRIRYYLNTGEALVKNTIRRELSNSEYHILNNVTVAFDDGTTQIDHIVVSRYGIFVIETKHYSGWIFGDQNSKQWTEVIYGFKYKFQNPIQQNYKHLLAVQGMLDFEPKEHIHSIVVFTGNSTFKSIIPANVVKVGQLINYIKTYNKVELSENRMQFCIGRIESRRYQISHKTDVDHLSYLSSKYYRNKRK